VNTSYKKKEQPDLQKVQK